MDYGTLDIEPNATLDDSGSITIEPGASYSPLGTVNTQPGVSLNLLNVSTPSFSGLSTSSITYGTDSTTISGTLDSNSSSQNVPADETIQVTLDGITQDAAIDDNDNFTTTVDTATLPASSTPYTIGFSYGGDADFTSATGSSTLTVRPASPSFNIVGTPPITYGATSTTIVGALVSNTGGPNVPEGETIQVTLDGVIQNVPLDDNDNFTATFNTSTLAASSTPYTISISYGGDGNFASASGSSTLAVNQAMPTFSIPSSPPITYGTATTTISGTLNANADGQTVPSGETVVVTLDGVTQSAKLNGSDSFSTTFNIITLAASSTPYTIGFSYGGDANFTSATGSSTLTVNQATPSITWNNPSPIAYFMPLGGNQLDASANVLGTFVYTPAAGTLLSAGTHSLSVTFTPTNAADYTSATATVPIVVLGTGVTVVGTQLYLVGGATTNDTVQINPAGSSNTGSTGVQVHAGSNGVNTQTTYGQTFSAIDVLARRQRERHAGQ